MIPAIDIVLSPLDDADPLRCRAPLPLVAMCHPIGFSLEIATNAPEVLAVAGELWAGYPRLSNSKPVRFHVAVEDAQISRRASDTAQGQPVVRGREHLVSVIESPRNFAVADLSRGFAYASLTHDLAADQNRFRYYFLEPLVHLMIDSLHTTPLHASCVALPHAGNANKARAAVLCGPSGAGKTSLAYACARRGWTYLSGDATHLLRRGNGHTVAGRPHHIRFRVSARRLFPELNAFPPMLRPNGKCGFEVDTGRLGIPTAYRAQARAVVFLHRHSDSSPAEIHSFPREKAQHILQQVVCYGEDDTRRQQIAALDRFLDLPLFALHYRDLDEAERALRQLLI